MKTKRVSRSYVRFLPRVATADSNVGVREKVMYTLASLLIYLVCTKLPLYGITSLIFDDLFYPFNSILTVLGSVRGTVMNHAILSIVFSRLFMIFCKGPKYFEVNTDIPENRDLVHDVQKLVSMILSSVISVKFVMVVSSRLHGTADQLGVGNAILLLFQCWFPCIIVMYLDELLQRGYGFGPGISLFIATSICEDIVWKAFYQQNLHYVTNLLGTILIFLIVVYLQGLYVLLPLRSRYRIGPLLPLRSANGIGRFLPLRPRTGIGRLGSYQIKFFYATSTPFFILSLDVSFFCMVILRHRNHSRNFFVDLLGKWNKSEYAGGQPIPVGGVAYLITAPSSLADMAVNPFRALFYLMFMTSTCVFLSKVWVRISGISVVHVSFRLWLQGMIVSESTGLHLYIPSATALGGVCIVALTVLADLTGAFGSASGILFAVTVISEHLETFEKKKETELVSLDPLGC